MFRVESFLRWVWVVGCARQVKATLYVASFLYRYGWSVM